MHLGGATHTDALDYIGAADARNGHKATAAMRTPSRARARACARVTAASAVATSDESKPRESLATSDRAWLKRVAASRVGAPLMCAPLRLGNRALLCGRCMPYVSRQCFAEHPRKCVRRAGAMHY